MNDPECATKDLIYEANIQICEVKTYKMPVKFFMSFS